MNQHNERAAVENLLSAYSQAVNSADTNLLSDVYSESGIFMPMGYRALSGRDELKRSAKRVFKNRQLNISFKIQDIAFDENYAFVHATSSCIVQHLPTGKVSRNSGKDFFVLRKEMHEWKVYRYMFNE